MSLNTQENMAKVRKKFPKYHWAKIADSFGSILAISHLMPMKSAAGWYALYRAGQGWQPYMS